MKLLKEYIIREIKKLVEEKYSVPPEILEAIEQTLNLKPSIRYIHSVKAANSVPPSYEVILHNTQSFFIIIEETSLMAKINKKSYWLDDQREVNDALKELNRLLTQPFPQPKPAPDKDDQMEPKS